MLKQVALAALLAGLNCGVAFDVMAETHLNGERQLSELEKYRTRVAAIPASIKLVDHNGHEQDVAKLIRENIVIADFIFTSCRSICPIMTAVMQKIYSKIGDSPQRPVLFISITVNPEEDTPEQMAESAKHTGNHANWLWLTGTPRAITEVSKAFAINAYDRPETHPPALFVGTEDDWFKWVGLPNSDEVAGAVKILSETRLK